MGETTQNGAAPVASKLEAARERKAKRDEVAAKALDALELEALELEEKYTEAGQVLGIDFAIHTTMVGNFAVRKPDFLVAKKFADAEKKSVEEVVQFVAPCVMFPEQMTARAVFLEHAGIAWALAKPIMQLYEADAGKKAGK